MNSALAATFDTCAPSEKLIMGECPTKQVHFTAFFKLELINIQKNMLNVSSETDRYDLALV